MPSPAHAPAPAKAAAADTPWTRRLVVTWLVLVALTVAGPALEGSRVLLAVAAVKFAAIGLLYMELAHAHPAWRVLLVGYAGLVAAFCAIAL